MAFETYILYLAAVAVFFATPPDTSQLLIISNSARYGLRRSTLTIAGDLTANSLQMTGAAFGLAAIIATSASAFIWIKWLGVAYLVWIGLQLVLSKENAAEVSATESAKSRRLFRQGFVTSMANPFAVVFFGALFPQFINPALPVLPQLLILGVTYLVVDGAILLAWGWLGARAAIALKKYTFGCDQQDLRRLDDCRRGAAGQQGLPTSEVRSGTELRTFAAPQSPGRFGLLKPASDLPITAPYAKVRCREAVRILQSPLLRISAARTRAGGGPESEDCVEKLCTCLPQSLLIPLSYWDREGSECLGRKRFTRG